MSVEELKQVVEKWKNEKGTERAAILITAEGCADGESQYSELVMRGDRDRLVAAMQFLLNVKDVPFREMVREALLNCVKMKDIQVISVTNIQENGEAH